MKTLARVVLAIAVAFVTTAPARVSAQKPDVADLLAKTATYLAAYEKAFSVVVSEEVYSQVLLVTARYGVTRKERALRSDVLQTSIGQTDWVAFRDVFEVDGAPVRDRDTRLQKLFVEAPNQAVAQAKRILAESARYNVGSIQRNVNVPTMALTYLRGSNQERSTFSVYGRQEVGGVPAVILAFKERAKPTVIRSEAGDLPATGRFWIEAESGRVLKSELSVAGKLTLTKITVTYGAVPKLPVWAPILMKEEYTGRESIFAEAKYSNFRQFSVAVAEAIK